jgi:hypothetical protein
MIIVSGDADGVPAECGKECGSVRRRINDGMDRGVCKRRDIWQQELEMRRDLSRQNREQSEKYRSRVVWKERKKNVFRVEFMHPIKGIVRGLAAVKVRASYLKRLISHSTAFCAGFSSNRALTRPRKLSKTASSSFC